MYGNDTNISIEIMQAFRPLDYTLEMVSFQDTYQKIKSVLPSNKIIFSEFDCETMIGCEVVCAAICHKINWDVLRQSVYEYTREFPNWLEPTSLKEMTSSKVEVLLRTYDISKIKADERSKMLREIGGYLVNHGSSFTDIFFECGELRDYEQVIANLQEIAPFSQDLIQKKVRLLIQTLTDYKEFEKFQSFFEPTIDYHLIRLFLRRGVVQSVNQVGRNFLLLDKIRSEQTMAALRKVCADSLRELCWITSMSVKEVNRIEWWIGRSVCVRGQPDCFLKGEDSEWLRAEFERCPYADTCQARNGHTDFLMLNEPDYNGTSY